MKKFTLLIGTLFIVLAFQNCDFVGSPGSASGGRAVDGRPFMPPANSGNGDLYDGKGNPFVALLSTGICADGEKITSQIDVDDRGRGWLVRDNCRTLSSSEQVQVTYTLDPLQPWILNANGTTYYGIVRSYKGIADVSDGATYAIAGVNSPAFNAAVLTKYDRDGNLAWTRRVAENSGLRISELTSVTALPDGGAIVGGYLGDSLRPASGDARAGETVFLASFTQDGFLRWSRAFDFAPATSRWTSLASDPSGSLVATASLSSSDPAVDQSSVVLKVDGFGQAVWQKVFAKDQLTRTQVVSAQAGTTVLVGLSSTAGVTSIVTLNASGVIQSSFGLPFAAYRSAVVSASGDILIYGAAGFSSVTELFVGRYSSDGSVMRWIKSMSALAPRDLVIRETPSGALNLIGSIGTGYVNTPYAVQLAGDGSLLSYKNGTASLRTTLNYFTSSQVTEDARGSSLWFAGIDDLKAINLYRIDLASLSDWQAAAAPAMPALSHTPQALTVAPQVFTTVPVSNDPVVGQAYGLQLPLRTQLR